MTFYDYIFLRKVNSALTHCSDDNYIKPDKLFCGLSITSPRAPTLSPSEEKNIFLSAILLTDGFYYGQTSFLTPVQFIGISYLFNYFGDYELPYNDGMI